IIQANLTTHYFPTRRSSDLIPSEKIILPNEASELINRLTMLIRQSDKNNQKGELKYWNETTSIREAYRSLIKNGISGVNMELSIDRKSTRLNSSHVSISYAV